MSRSTSPPEYVERFEAALQERSALKKRSKIGSVLNVWFFFKLDLEVIPILRNLTIYQFALKRLITVDLRTKLSIASYLQIKLRTISDVALNLIVADSFCLASRLR